MKHIFALCLAISVISAAPTANNNNCLSSCKNPTTIAVYNFILQNADKINVPDLVTRLQNAGFTTGRGRSGRSGRGRSGGSKSGMFGNGDMFGSGSMLFDGFFDDMPGFGDASRSMFVDFGPMFGGGNGMYHHRNGRSGGRFSGQHGGRNGGHHSGVNFGRYNGRHSGEHNDRHFGGHNNRHFGWHNNGQDNSGQFGIIGGNDEQMEENEEQTEESEGQNGGNSGQFSGNSGQIGGNNGQFSQTGGTTSYIASRIVSSIPSTFLVDSTTLKSSIEDIDNLNIDDLIVVLGDLTNENIQVERSIGLMRLNKSFILSQLNDGPLTREMLSKILEGGGIIGVSGGQVGGNDGLQSGQIGGSVGGQTGRQASSTITSSLSGSIPATFSAESSEITKGLSGMNKINLRSFIDVIRQRTPINIQTSGNIGDMEGDMPYILNFLQSHRNLNSVTLSELLSNGFRSTSSVTDTSSGATGQSGQISASFPSDFSLKGADIISKLSGMKGQQISVAQCIELMNTISSNGKKFTLSNGNGSSMQLDVTSLLNTLNSSKIYDGQDCMDLLRTNLNGQTSSTTGNGSLIKLPSNLNGASGGSSTFNFGTKSIKV